MEKKVKGSNGCARPGSGRKPLCPEKKRMIVSFRLNEEEMLILKNLSKELNRPMSEIIRLFLLTGKGVQQIAEIEPERKIRKETTLKRRTEEQPQIRFKRA